MITELRSRPAKRRTSALLETSLSSEHFSGAAPPRLSAPDIPGPIAVLVFLWAFVCLSTNLKVAMLPYVDWYLSIPVLIWALGHFKPDRLLARSLFLCAILIGGVLADNLPVALVWIAKLALIFTAIASFQRVPALNPILWSALVASLYGNVACLLLGELGLTFFADVVTSEGRLGTVLNLPGSLWHIGMSLALNYLYLIVTTSKNKLWNLTSFIACLYVIFCDGGRTAVLFVLMIPVVLFCLLAREGRISRVIPFAGGVILAAAIGFTAFELDESVAVTRIMPMLTGATRDAAGLEALDGYRYQMLQRARDLIYEHPIMGNGVLSARILTNLESVESMNVHNAYLQIWADLGLLGLVSFLFVVFGWMKAAPAWIRSIVRLPDTRLRAGYYNALFTLLWFALSLLFHPFSSEWSEWILFLTPFCLLMKLTMLAPNSSVPSQIYRLATANNSILARGCPI